SLSWSAAARAAQVSAISNHRSFCLWSAVARARLSACSASRLACAISSLLIHVALRRDTIDTDSPITPLRPRLPAGVNGDGEGGGVPSPDRGIATAASWGHARS